jgi:hypothetical protein
LDLKSLFTESDNLGIIERINSLKPNSGALWGKMNVAQMMAHCTIALKACTGEIKPKKVFLSFLFRKIARKQVFGSNDLRKRTPSAREYIVRDKKDFETEKSGLISYVGKFYDSGPGIVTKEPHAFFGILTAEEWDILMWKHLDHHLRQFGV